MTPKNGKGEFSSAVKPFYDNKNLTEKDFCAAKRFLVNQNNLCAQAGFPCVGATQFVAQASSPEVNSRDYIIEGL